MSYPPHKPITYPERSLKGSSFVLFHPETNRIEFIPNLPEGWDIEKKKKFGDFHVIEILPVDLQFILKERKKQIEKFSHLSEHEKRELIYALNKATIDLFREKATKLENPPKFSEIWDEYHSWNEFLRNYEFQKEKELFYRKRYGSGEVSTLKDFHRKVVEEYLQKHNPDYLDLVDCISERMLMGIPFTRAFEHCVETEK
ncbi:MAG: hypothetical protein QXG39_03285 [Candidatus Aenigmatarchaeota archaeon]